MSVTSAIIDDLSREPPIAAIGSNWQILTDQVMGGVSKGTMVRDAVAGRPAIRMRGDVSLENNGGFIQIALDLSPDGELVDASACSGIELDVFGNGEDYGVHLRTKALTRPWQSIAKASMPTRSGGRFSCRLTILLPIARIFCSILIGCGASAWSPLAAPSRPISLSVGCGS
jgi:hypothetical protein